MCTVCLGGWTRSSGLFCESCAGGNDTVFAKWLVFIFLMIPLAFATFWWFKRRGARASRAASVASSTPAPSALKQAAGSMHNLGKKLRLRVSILTASAQGQDSKQARWWHSLTVKIKIVVAFLQIISQILTVFDIPYPENFVQFVHSMAFINLDLVNIMRVGCVTHVNFYDKLFTATLVPLLLLAAMCTATALARRSKMSETFVKAVRNTSVKVFLLLTFFIFPSVSTTVLRAFPCRTFDDGRRLLKADYSIDCDAPERPGYVSYAVLMVLVYPVGVTVLYATLLWKQRHLICPEERPWRSVCGVNLIPPIADSLADDDALLAERDRLLQAKGDAKYSHLRATQFLFKEYEPRFWWFEAFECVRRLMITGGTVFFLEGSATQIVIALLVSLVSIQVYSLTQPYLEDEDNVLAMTAQWGIFFTLFMGLLVKTKVPTDDGYNGTLGGLLIFVNVVVIVLAFATFLYIFTVRYSSPLNAANSTGGSGAAGLHVASSSRARSKRAMNGSARANLARRAREIYAAKVAQGGVTDHQESNNLSNRALSGRSGRAAVL
jgi:hypothetical protein